VDKIKRNNLLSFYIFLLSLSLYFFFFLKKKGKKHVPADAGAGARDDGLAAGHRAGLAGPRRPGQGRAAVAVGCVRVGAHARPVAALTRPRARLRAGPAAAISELAISVPKTRKSQGHFTCWSRRTKRTTLSRLWQARPGRARSLRCCHCSWKGTLRTDESAAACLPGKDGKMCIFI
jgi:hypothetical protein